MEGSFSVVFSPDRVQWFSALTALVFPCNVWHCAQKLPCQNRKLLENALSQLIENGS